MWQYLAYSPRVLPSAIRGFVRLPSNWHQKMRGPNCAARNPLRVGSPQLRCMRPPVYLGVSLNTCTHQFLSFFCSPGEGAPGAARPHTCLKGWTAVARGLGAGVPSGMVVLMSMATAVAPGPRASPLVTEGHMGMRAGAHGGGQTRSGAPSDTTDDSSPWNELDRLTRTH